MATVHKLREIPLASIDAPKRPARRFLGDIAALAESMQDYGLQQPISVRAEGDRYALTSGLRRLSAAQMLRWETIPAFVRTVSADDAYLLDLVENLQRQDLSAEEEADALGELIRTRAWTLQQVANAVKRSVGYVSKRIRLFDDPTLRTAVVERGLPLSTAEELLAAKPDQRAELSERALAERWDQVRARDAIRAPVLAAHVVNPDNKGAAEVARSRADRRSASVAAERPQGFTRAIREFHRLIMNVRAQALTSADRSALRSLFRDLVILARAPSEPAPRVIPPLPKVPDPKRSRVRPSSRTGRR